MAKLENLAPLLESIITFDQYPTPKALKRAKDIYEDASETEILKAAAEGDNDAINFIFDKVRKQIAQAFWKYYLGPNKAKWSKMRINRGDAATFLNLVIEGLKSSDSNPLLTFDPSKYKEGDKINKFGYYLMRYAQSWAFKAIKAEKNQGMSNTAGKAKISSVDKTNEFGDTQEIGVVDSSEEDFDIKDSFTRWLKSLDDERDRQIMKMRLSGVEDLDEIAAAVFPGKKSGQPMVRMRLQKLMKDFKSYIGMN